MRLKCVFANHEKIGASIIVENKEILQHKRG